MANFLKPGGFRKTIFMELFFLNNSRAIFLHLSPTSSHFHPLQVENCDNNSRLVVVEDDNGKLRLETVSHNTYGMGLRAVYIF